MRVDPAAVGATHGVRAAVRLAAQPVEDVFKRAVVDLVLVKQFLLPDLGFGLQLVDDGVL